jgi:iron(II)-dependent oxidoreductase
MFMGIVVLRATLVILVMLVVWGALACSHDDKFEFSSDAYRDAPPTELLDVPAGPFTMGSPFSQDFFDGANDQPFSDEHPQHEVTLAAYRIEARETTNAQHRACVSAGACVDPAITGPAGVHEYYINPKYDDYPVLYVTWDMADAYCRWRGRRLPTEAEWEKAARGAADDRSYPWGWAEPTCDLADISVLAPVPDDPDDAVYETCFDFPVEVGAYSLAASPYGVQQMTGNVAEWTGDWYADDYYDQEVWPDNAENPQGPPDGDEKVVRGGGWADTAIYARVSFRGRLAPQEAASTIGFRCATGEAD